MLLTEKEKKLLTVLHEARLVDKKFLKGYQKMIEEHFSFSYEGLDKLIAKFLKNKLLKEITLGDNEVMYFHTNKVTKEMIDDKLSNLGR